jgi:hypothetical protein
MNYLIICPNYFIEKHKKINTIKKNQSQAKTILILQISFFTH